MASEIDIANLALAHLGDDAIVASFDPPEGGPQAEQCARFYPLARDTLLEMHAWSFATRTAVLTPIGNLLSDDWSHAYVVPNGCLKPLGLYAAGWRRHEQDTPEYELETLQDEQQVIYTRLGEARLRYIARVTDPTRFPPLFVDALSWLLASMLAGPVIKGDSGVAAGKSAWQVFLTRFADASESDANRSGTKLDHIPDWIRARGRSLPDTSIDPDFGYRV